MATNNNVTFVGQILKPELRYTNSGKAVASTRMVVKTQEMVKICGLML